MHPLVAIVSSVLVLAADPRPSASPPPATGGGIDASPTVQLDPCTTASPDASATLVRFEQAVYVSSSGIAYGSRDRACRRFVVEFHVPHDAIGPSSGLGVSSPDYKVEAELAANPGSKQSCITTTLAVDVHHKAAGAKGFVLKTQVKYAGKWHASGNGSGWCEMALVEGGPMPNQVPNLAGDETWRLLIDARRGNAKLGVEAKVGFTAYPG